MKTERLEELVWELVDGEISDEDRLFLQEYLVGRADAEATRREFVTLAARLDAVESLEPPPALRRRIDEALAAMPIPGEVTPPVPMHVPPPTMTWRMRASYLAAGLLVGVGLTFLFLAGSGQEIDQSALYGSVQQVPLADASSFDLEGGSGTLAVEGYGSRRTLDLDLEHEGPVVMELESASGVVRLESVGQDGSITLDAGTDGGRLVLSLTGPATVRLVVDVGERSASLFVAVTTEDAGREPSRLFAREISNGQ